MLFEEQMHKRTFIKIDLKYLLFINWNFKYIHMIPTDVASSRGMYIIGTIDEQSTSLWQVIILLQLK